jgi:hypothetical protein
MMRTCTSRDRRGKHRRARQKDKKPLIKTSQHMKILPSRMLIVRVRLRPYVQRPYSRTGDWHSSHSSLTIDFKKATFTATSVDILTVHTLGHNSTNTRALSIFVPKRREADRLKVFIENDIRPIRGLYATNRGVGRRTKGGHCRPIEVFFSTLLRKMAACGKNVKRFTLRM